MQVCYRDSESITELVQSLICTDFSPTPSSGHTVLLRGYCYHKFSRCLINHFNARLASFSLSGLIRYMQSSYIQCYLHMYNSVWRHEWRPTFYAVTIDYISAYIIYAVTNMHACRQYDRRLSWSWWWSSKPQPFVSTRELAIVWPFIHEQINERLLARAKWVWLPVSQGSSVIGWAAAECKDSGEWVEHILLYEFCMYLMRPERPKLVSRALKWFINTLRTCDSSLFVEGQCDHWKEWAKSLCKSKTVLFL